MYVLLYLLNVLPFIDGSCILFRKKGNIGDFEEILGMGIKPNKLCELE